MRLTESISAQAEKTLRLTNLKMIASMSLVTEYKRNFAVFMFAFVVCE